MDSVAWGRLEGLVLEYGFERFEDALAAAHDTGTAREPRKSDWLLAQVRAVLTEQRQAAMIQEWEDAHPAPRA